MKKQIIAGVVALSLVCFFGAGCSKKHGPKPNQVKGSIVSVDPVKNEAVIKDKYTGEKKTVIVDSKDIAGLKPGKKIKVMLKPGTNTAESIKLHTPKQKNDDEDSGE